jgi:hypothetical protein
MATRVQMLRMQVLTKKSWFRRVLAFAKRAFLDIFGDSPNLKHSPSIFFFPSIFWILAKLAFAYYAIANYSPNLTAFGEFGKCFGLQLRMRESYKRFIKTWISIDSKVTNPDLKRFDSYRRSQIQISKGLYRIVDHKSSQFSKGSTNPTNPTNLHKSLVLYTK